MSLPVGGAPPLRVEDSSSRINAPATPPAWGDRTAGGSLPAIRVFHPSVTPEAPGEEQGVQRPVAARHQMEGAGYILSAEPPPAKRIVATMEDRETLAEGDVVYVNLGKAEGAFPGATFFVYRLGRLIVHPFTQKPLGYLVTVLGTLEVIDSQEKTSVAMVADSYNNPIFKGDRIAPFEEIEVPQVDLLKIPEAKEIQGVIVALKDDKQFAGHSDIVYLDRGGEDGVTPGDVFTVYRPGKVIEELALEKIQLPQVELGELTVISTQERTATALITYSAVEMRVGDRVAYKYKP
ncbi:MAG: hypothetical protein HYY20_11275 [Candidatus Tectomicrobia bacterium]|uniref:Uncharacterized protein n=1 Tax=Tectimicrobiota bacterium TaxID=2528274 RepID=A0A932FXD2_UNCTE|nr:hypothetical protein [Candidatus Tectomicrobia bacterium]